MPLISTHMYYSKTFVPGQFSPDYWEVNTLESLEQYSVGKVFLPNTIYPSVTLVRPTELSIVDLDEMSIEANDIYGSYTLGAFEFDEATVGPELAYSGSFIGAIQIAETTVEVMDSYIGRAFSTTDFDEVALNLNSYTYNTVNVLVPNERLIQSSSYSTAGTITTLILNEDFVSVIGALAYTSELKPYDVLVEKTNIGFVSSNAIEANTDVSISPISELTVSSEQLQVNQPITAIGSVTADTSTYNLI